MQGKQLIIPHHPQLHRMRIAALVGLSALAVGAVGAVQGMMTVSKNRLAQTHNDFAVVAESVDKMHEEAANKTQDQSKNLGGLVEELRRVLSDQSSTDTAAESGAEDSATVATEGAESTSASSDGVATNTQTDVSPVAE